MSNNERRSEDEWRMIPIQSDEQIVNGGIGGPAVFKRLHLHLYETGDNSQLVKRFREQVEYSHGGTDVQSSSEELEARRLARDGEARWRQCLEVLFRLAGELSIARTYTLSPPLLLNAMSNVPPPPPSNADAKEEDGLEAELLADGDDLFGTQDNTTMSAAAAVAAAKSTVHKDLSQQVVTDTVYQLCGLPAPDRFSPGHQAREILVSQREALLHSLIQTLISPGPYGVPPLYSTTLRALVSALRCYVASPNSGQLSLDMVSMEATASMADQMTMETNALVHDACNVGGHVATAIATGKPIVANESMVWRLLPRLEELTRELTLRLNNPVIAHIDLALRLTATQLAEELPTLAQKLMDAAAASAEAAAVAAASASVQNNAASGPSNGGPLTLTQQLFSYVLAADSLSAWLDRTITTMSATTSDDSSKAKSAEIEYLLCHPRLALRRDESKGTAPIPPPNSPAEAAGSGLPLSQVVRLLHRVQRALSAIQSAAAATHGSSHGDTAHAAALIHTMELCFQQALQQKSIAAVRLYGLFLFGLHRLNGISARRLLHKVFHAICSRYALLIPNFLPSDLSSIEDGVSDSKTAATAAAGIPGDEQLWAVSLYASMVSYSGETAGIESPVSLQTGWLWLSRALRQVHFLYFLRDQRKDANPDECAAYGLRVDLAYKSISVFLRGTAYVLSIRYQSSFTELLSTTKTMLEGQSQNSSSEYKELHGLLSALLKDPQQHPPLLFNNQGPGVIENTILASGAANLAGEVADADADKNSPFFEAVKAADIHRMRVIFNRIGSTSATHARAVDQLLEKLVAASSSSAVHSSTFTLRDLYLPPASDVATQPVTLLQYTLYKVVANMLTDIQQEHFNEMSEPQPLALARVACGLCLAIGELRNVIRSHFFNACPLLMPKVLSEGLSTDDFFASMGFRPSRDGAWESRDAWLTRMSKLLAVFAVMSIQPEQAPFSLTDLWDWLIRTVNSTARVVVGGRATAPFYIATMLEVVLRIASPALLDAQGDKFLRVLESINKDLLPHFAEEMPKRSGFAEFLRRYTTSRGSDFMILFNVRAEGN